MCQTVLWIRQQRRLSHRTSAQILSWAVSFILAPNFSIYLITKWGGGLKPLPRQTTGKGFWSFQWKKTIKADNFAHLKTATHWKNNKSKFI